jgi:hypothetical protein
MLHVEAEGGDGGQCEDTKPQVHEDTIFTPDGQHG